MSADAILKDILTDAILVANYGRRTGQIATADLYDAIQRASALPALSFSAPEVRDLQVALARSVRAIEPITVLDLRRWNPEGRQPWTTRIACIVLTLSLVLGCAYYSAKYAKAVAYGSALQEASEAKLDELVTVVASNLPADAATDPKVIDQISATLIFRTTDEIRSTAARMERNMRLAQELYAELALVPRLSGAISSTLDQLRANAAAPTDLIRPEGAMLPGSSCGLAPDQVGAEPIMAGLGTGPGQWSFESTIDARDRLKDRIRCVLRIGSNTQIGAVGNAIDTMKDVSEALGIWILPMLYGALGAMVYYLRIVTNPLLPDPNLAKILLRVTLGGFAGVAVGWFHAAGDPVGLHFRDLGLGAFTIAFVFGFSVDVFFALLDRIVTISASAVGRIGEPSQKTA